MPLRKTSADECVSCESAEQSHEKSMTPEQIDRHWYENVYQGDDMPQLTVRAVIMGMLLGGFMSLSNLYVGLKTGWGVGVAITACILSYAIWTTLRRLFPHLITSDMSILENNAMQSTASSAGYSTGGTMVSAVAAYLIITGHQISFWVLTAWTFFLAVLGVMMAIPMKRQMINVEQLRFPSGIAAATTLKSLHLRGDEAVRQARSLFYAGGVGMVIAWMRDAMSLIVPKFSIPSLFEIPFLSVGGVPAIQYTFAFEGSLLLVAAGAIMGFKVAWSMLLGAVINYGFLAPYVYGNFIHIDPASGAVVHEAIESLGYRGIVSWSMWPGAAIMVSSGIVSFALQGKTVLRGFSLFRKEGASAAGENPVDRIEVPNSWFLLGTLVSGIACVVILHYAFHTAFWMGIPAVLLTFFLAMVACRATGETDTTPIGAMGKITQLTYGVLAPADMVTNLMTAGVTAGAAGSSADLLTDLKSGYILGANPRKQFLAQLLGVFAGTAIIVPAFYLIVPEASVLGSDRFPAPAAQVWAGVATMLSKGISSLHPAAQWGIIIGLVIGIALPLLEIYSPEKVKQYIPSPMGLGLALVIPAYNSISMFMGGLVALLVAKKIPDIAGTYTIPVASGIIAGESLMGVAIALLISLKIIG
ncbi:MAG TPA: OPT family oligopeptide transporter [Methanothrix sp.]|nr:OPT family oligopeptide transporter [Methanothrix sp.]